MIVRRILLVDDDPILRDALAAHFASQRHHFTVTMVKDGFEAVKVLEKMPFSLVITDLVMPRMDGISLLSHLRDGYPDIPIIVISGTFTQEMTKLAKMEGVIACFCKPFPADDLTLTIRESLQREAQSGTMHDISPAVFLQLMEMEEKTCTIRIFDQHSPQGGVLYFIDGALVDARIGRKRGMDAAFLVFTWEAATIYMQNGCEPRSNTINSPLQAIIMKAASAKDEALAPEEDEDSERTETSPALPANNPPAAPPPAASLQLYADPAIARINKLLREQGGLTCDILAIEPGSESDALRKLDEIGKILHFGQFCVGFRGETDSGDILLPGNPPLRAELAQTGNLDRILCALRKERNKLSR
jgi:CheY-like chemotaxis protein